MSDQPPRLAEFLLLKIVGGRDAEIVAGDLRETYASQHRGAFWYWTQVVSCLFIRLSPYRRLIPDLRRDLHYAFRMLRRNRGYALTAVVCLGLGIGVNTTVFSWLDEMYFRKLPVPEAERVVSIDRAGGPACSWREYLDLRRGLRTFSGIAAVIPKGTFLDVDRVNDQIHAEVVSANYFEVLRIQPQLGRAFVASEDNSASVPVAVISDEAWSRHFKRDPQAVGRSIRIEDQWYQIAGIAPASFRGVSAPLAIDAWVPLPTYPHYRSQLMGEVRSGGPNVYLVGRLAQKQLVSQATAEIQVMDASLLTARFKNRMTVRVVEGYGSAEVQRGLRPVAVLLTAVVCVVLLIACVNVANLLLSRAAVRQQEMAVRRALGAGHAQLVRQGITEGVVLAMGGAAVGILLGFWTNRLITAVLPAAHPEMALHTLHLDINWRVAAFTAAISFFCALLFSVAPALENARVDVTPGLKYAWNRTSPSARWKRNWFVVAQVALSLMLLIAASLLVRALQEARSTDPGFATGKRIYIRLFTPDNDFTPQNATSLYARLLDEARALPGVRNATLSFAVFGFMDGDCATAGISDSPRKVSINVIEPNYFDFMQTPLLRGRSFVTNDRPESRRVIVVNETMASSWWPGQDPIGKTAWLGCQGVTKTPAEVVGVVRDSKYGSLDEQPRPFYFVHWKQVWWNGFFALMLHTDRELRDLEQPLLRLAQTGGPNLRIYELRSFDDLIALSLFRVRWQATLLSAFSLLAIGLAMVGLYGVIAYTVARRTREIGVRIALGAQSGDVKWMVLGHSLRLTAAGVVLGLMLGAAVTQLLRRFLFGVSPLDPVAFIASALAWVLLSMLASYIPARRATRVDPVVALRYE